MQIATAAEFIDTGGLPCAEDIVELQSSLVFGSHCLSSLSFTMVPEPLVVGDVPFVVEFAMTHRLFSLASWAFLH